MGAHDVLVAACGGLEDCDGATEPESKNELLRDASLLIRDESARLPLVAGVVVAAPAWVPPRTTAERTPNPTAAAPAAAALRNRARRRAGARREGEGDAEDTLS